MSGLIDANYSDRSTYIHQGKLGVGSAPKTFLMMTTVVYVLTDECYMFSVVGGERH